MVEMESQLVNSLGLDFTVYKVDVSTALASQHWTLAQARKGQPVHSGHP